MKLNKHYLQKPQYPFQSLGPEGSGKPQPTTKLVKDEKEGKILVNNKVNQGFINWLFGPCWV